MFRLGNPDYLYAFLAIPLIILLYMWMIRWKKNALKRFGETSLIQQLAPDVSKNKARMKFVFLTIGFLFLIAGIVDPQSGYGLKEMKRQGSDIIIALDVSNSMNAEDIYPSRLEKAKEAIEKLIDNMNGDRIGIVVFAGEAYVQLPITTDYAAAKLFLSTISTNMVPVQGTAIGTAIDLASESFGKDDQNTANHNKAIILITDGENHEDDAVTAAQNAAKKGIVINTIGMGTEQGAPIPVQPLASSGQVTFMKDKDGNTVITKLDQQALEEIAAAGNGTFIRASNSDVGLQTILASIKKLGKKTFESNLYNDYEDRFQYFIAAALLLLIAEVLFTERKSKLWKKLNLFGTEKS
ncbi:MAG TPA: VWA domain-containing protein [Bacteroidia bacterium]|nr:VWA domain-containing protein [Bacteroidia bacterium]